MTDLASALRKELDRRIAALAALGDSDFGGPLSSVELAVCVVAFAVVPSAIVWLFR